MTSEAAGASPGIEDADGRAVPFEAALEATLARWGALLERLARE